MIREATEKLFARAYAAHQAGRPADAERLYRNVLRSNPRDSDARNLLGLLFLQQERFAESANEIRRALELRPDNPESLYNLGSALLGDGDPEGAVSCFRKVCEITESNVAAMQALSAALNDAAVKCSDPQESLRLHSEALECDPTNERAAINLGILQEQIGDFPGAAISFSKAIDAKPDFADAHFHLAHLKEHQSSDTDIAGMTALFQRSEGAEQALLAHGIAKALEKRKRYSEEFQWLNKAHAIKRNFEVYDREREERHFASLKNSTSADFPPGDRGSEFVFIVGMPRSGTTLAEQILASHPDIRGAGEVMAVADLTASAGTSDDELARLFVMAAERITADARDERLHVETTPANFQNLAKIALLFPAARIVHCVRDPLDTCLSIFQHPLSAAHAYAHDLEDLGNYYLEYQDLMRHWQDTIPNPVFELRYESVVTDLEVTVRKLLRFCQAEFDERCLRFHETRRRVRTPSASQVRQPIYASSIGRWRRYESELAPLRAILERPG